MRRSKEDSKKRFSRPKRSQNGKPLNKKPADNSVFMPSAAGDIGAGFG